MVSAQLGEHVSSSTLSAHQMARAGEPVDSDGSIVWVRMHDGDTGTDAPVRPLGALRWVFGEMSAGKVLWYWNQFTRLTAQNGFPPLPPGERPRGEELGIPSPLLGCHFWRSCSVSACCLRSTVLVFLVPCCLLFLV